MKATQPLAPWAEEVEGDSSLDRRLSRVFRDVPEPSALPELQRRRVGARLSQRARRQPAWLMLRLVALGVAIGVGSAAAAQLASSRFLASQRQLATWRLPETAPPSPPAPRGTAPRAPRAEPVAQESPLEITPGPSSASFPAPAPVQSSRLGLEAASLEAALTELRGGGTARAERALQQLDRHLREFSGGALELEARIARVDALLTLGKRQDARRELAKLPIERVGRKHELRLIRAELAADQDCGQALPDFQVLVEQPLPRAFAERALFGRGACLLRLGDAPAAERDFARYLERFPDGRFAAQIRGR